MKYRDQIILGDCMEMLAELPDESVHCCVTSPPYWGLRDYGVAGQIGLEETPEAYVATMVTIFAEVRRVLRKDGTLWLNLGDSYAGSGCGWNIAESGLEGGQSRQEQSRRAKKSFRRDKASTHPAGRKHLEGKNLVGIPWRVALALQADGWYLRQDIIWHKPNPMPESVLDRCTKSHEYLFLLSQSPRYYYDRYAIMEDCSENTHARISQDLAGQIGSARANLPVFRRNKRSVWTVPTQAFSEAHFATFPEKLIEPCILAGCPREVCSVCGKGRKRIIESVPAKVRMTNSRYAKEANTKPHSFFSTGRQDETAQMQSMGWTDCGCGAGFEPGIVLDPFMGAGTAGLTAYKLGRSFVGIELNPEYREIALRRIAAERDNFGLLEA